MAGRNDFGASNIHCKGHWKGWALKIETFLPALKSLSPGAISKNRYNGNFMYMIWMRIRIRLTTLMRIRIFTWRGCGLRIRTGSYSIHFGLSFSKWCGFGSRSRLSLWLADPDPDFYSMLIQITKIMRILNTGSTWSTWRRLTFRSITSSCDPSTSCHVVFLKTISLSSSSALPSFWTAFPAASWALLIAAGSGTPREEAQRERLSFSIITRATRRTTPSTGRGKAFSALVEELPAVDEEEAGGDDS